MTDKIIMDPFAQPFAVDGVPDARPLTRDDLNKIQGALEDFKEAVADWDRRRSDERRRAESGQARQPQEGLGATAQNPSAGQQAPSALSGGNRTGASDAQPEKPGPQPVLTRHGSRQSAPGAGSASAQVARPMPEVEPKVQPSEDAFHCLILAGYLGKGYGPQQDLCTEDAVADACARHFGAGSASGGSYPLEVRLGRIHVILHSRGGSLDSAYKVMLFLRNFARDVRVYVPCRAKSAATLIAVGADQVVMSPFAELGPLDTQITDPRNPSAHVSALDCYRSVDYVREFGIQTISRALKVMLDETQGMLPLGQLMDSATTFAIGSVRPMLEQVKALDFGGWGRTLRIGETYAKQLRLRLNHPDSEDAAARIATRLVYGYTHHPYPIDRAEAVKSLGLAVDTMPENVYKAAKAIATACRDEARFVGFSEDVAKAISESAELEVRAQLPHAANAARTSADGSPQAYGRVSPY